MLAEVVQDADTAPPTAVEYPVLDCDRGRLIKVVFINLVLSILTLGVYRFWARTRVRRAFWSMVSFRGERIAYTGTGLELFVGFLIAMVALLPIFVAMQITSTLIPPTRFWLLTGVNMLYFTILATLGILGLFYARRYLLSRTRWRGIHAGQDGRAKEFFLVHLKAYGAVMLTLGLVQPWADALTYNYRMGITRFGTGRFSAGVTSRGLWAPYLAMLVLIYTSYVLFFMTYWPYLEFAQAAAEARQSGGTAPDKPDVSIWLLGSSVALFLVGLLAYYYYALVRFRLFTAGTRFETMRFTCDVPTRPMALIVGAYAGMLLAAVLLSVFTGILVGAALPGVIGKYLGIFAGFFLMMFLYSILSLVWFRLEVLRKIIDHLDITGPDALDEVVNRGEVAPRRGEGLADALGDVGMAI